MNSAGNSPVHERQFDLSSHPDKKRELSDNVSAWKQNNPVPSYCEIVRNEKCSKKEILAEVQLREKTAYYIFKEPFPANAKNQQWPIHVLKSKGLTQNNDVRKQLIEKVDYTQE